MTAQSSSPHRVARRRTNSSIKLVLSSQSLQKTPTTAKVQLAFQQAEKLYHITNARLRYRTPGPCDGPCPGAPRSSSMSLPNFEDSDSESDCWMTDICYYGTDEGWPAFPPSLLLDDADQGF
ncbi:hypothetical protein FRC14_002731 [Serendipita sp. 396]|nr:hypothetical protein FRC14_002731 [Serendipita sp. 396]KAG8789722.1 hypothetical protein FRC15_003791 [Serendipita sp. 397]KAG8804262.1 hypothetical protein FRC16_010591 [Serendipita sp. 398]KAG8807553.1 hypothetical protein FRC19_006608 [Serendipita sp. 401]KAG8858808.1 hypothetical protein FRB91_009309 [Serendipita sp. 411]KAG8877506.1 hypothetical protein FRC20_011175 [Serendipita sp. 405]